MSYRAPLLQRSVMIVALLLWSGVGVSARANTPEAQDPPLPAFPQGCQAIPLVGGTGNEVTKETSPPGLPIPFSFGAGHTRDNWNTDWVVPTNQTFRRFVVILMPRSSSKYDASMYLKYGDDTADKFYTHQGSLPANQPIVVQTQPRSTLQPYQVNVHVGGLQSIGVRYSVAVAACR